MAVAHSLPVVFWICFCRNRFFNIILVSGALDNCTGICLSVVPLYSYLSSDLSYRWLCYFLKLSYLYLWFFISILMWYSNFFFFFTNRDFRAGVLCLSHKYMQLNDRTEARILDFVHTSVLFFILSAIN